MDEGALPEPVASATSIAQGNGLFTRADAEPPEDREVNSAHPASTNAAARAQGIAIAGSRRRMGFGLMIRVLYLIPSVSEHSASQG